MEQISSASVLIIYEWVRVMIKTSQWRQNASSREFSGRGPLYKVSGSGRRRDDGKMRLEK